jgi:hypothetical protein
MAMVTSNDQIKHKMIRAWERFGTDLRGNFHIATKTTTKIQKKKKKSRIKSDMHMSNTSPASVAFIIHHSSSSSSQQSSTSYRLQSAIALGDGASRAAARRTQIQALLSNVCR